MTTLAEIREVFFEECQLQLEQLTDGLEQIAACPDTAPGPATIDTMFRAAHSIKGGAASFALHALTRYAHAFESLLNEMRGRHLVVDASLLRRLFEAVDYLSDLIAQGIQSAEPEADGFEKRLADLARITATDYSATSDGDRPAADLVLGFTPIALTFDPSQAAEPPMSRPRTFRMEFRPSAALYANGHEPLHLFRELATLGDLHVAALLEDSGRWQAKDPAITWKLTLQTDRRQQDVQEIFEFAESFAAIALLPPAEDRPASTLSEAPPRMTAPEPDQPDPASDGRIAAATARIDMRLIDDLINRIGELVIAQAAVTQAIADAGLGSEPALCEPLNVFRTLTHELQEGVMAIRAQPVKPLFQRMARIVRETAQIAGKPVRFVARGEETELDRTIIERLADPLTHILRNAIDHGLEDCDRRALAGKSGTGTVTLSAAHRSGRVVVEVSDDGGGIDRDRVLSTAIRKGLIPAHSAPTPAEIDRMLFLPGFSTAPAVTSLSGRGVGMDIVQSEIRRLGGLVSVSSEPGRGTVISISLPLTLAVLDGMIVRVAGQTLVIPVAAIQQTIRPAPAQIHPVGPASQVVSLRDAALPIVDLGRLLGYSHLPCLDRNGVLAIVHDGHGRECALAVDALQDQQQVVIKSLDSSFGQVPYVAAATILGNGEIALILDVEAIVQREIIEKTSQHVPKGKIA